MYNVQYMYMYMCTVQCTLNIEDTKTVGIIHIIHACTLKDMHNVHVHLLFCFPQRKPMFIHLHHDGSVLSNVFCRYSACNTD